MRISLDEASLHIEQGGVVALPTETVYGLAASLHHPEAIGKIFSLKGRPQENPLIIHVASLEKVLPFVSRQPQHLLDLAHHFWPGPLTLVLPVHTALVPAVARAGLPTAAFRVPGHPLMLQLLEQVGPIVAPSANLSGSPSSTQPDHVEQDFGLHFPVVDDGPCSGGIESTILLSSASEWAMGRLGALPAAAFRPVLGYLPQGPLENTQLPCPGGRFKHYAPHTALLLSCEPYRGEASVILGFSDRTYPASAHFIPLGPSTKPAVVAAHLYSALRALDELQQPKAWVDFAIPREGLWATLRERLERAASGSR